MYLPPEQATPLPLEVVPSYAATPEKSSGIGVPLMEKLATIFPRPALTQCHPVAFGLAIRRNHEPS